MPRFGRKRVSRALDGTRLFFATDVHGSDVCFRKFVNAGRFYDVRYLILGGDITGKAIVPIERTSRGWSASYLDDSYVDMSDAERGALERRIRDAGLYPLRGERDELLALQDKGHRQRIFVGL